MGLTENRSASLHGSKVVKPHQMAVTRLYPDLDAIYHAENVEMAHPDDLTLNNLEQPNVAWKQLYPDLSKFNINENPDSILSSSISQRLTKAVTASKPHFHRQAVLNEPCKKANSREVIAESRKNSSPGSNGELRQLGSEDKTQAGKQSNIETAAPKEPSTGPDYEEIPIDYDLDEDYDPEEDYDLWGDSSTLAANRNTVISAHKFLADKRIEIPAPPPVHQGNKDNLYAWSCWRTYVNKQLSLLSQKKGDQPVYIPPLQFSRSELSHTIIQSLIRSSQSNGRCRTKLSSRSFIAFGIPRAHLSHRP